MRSLAKNVLPVFTLSLLFSTALLAKTLTCSCPHGTTTFKVELAETPEQRAKGLMFREHLAENEGMLFLFPKPQTTAMWMKNTLLSLDMIFCNEQGKILEIRENTIPLSTKNLGLVQGV